MPVAIISCFAHGCHEHCDRIGVITACVIEHRRFQKPGIRRPWLKQARRLVSQARFLHRTLHTLSAHIRKYAMLVLALRVATCKRSVKCGRQYDHSCARLC